jgi:AmiR/NasT family two-component response regulator
VAHNLSRLLQKQHIAIVGLVQSYESLIAVSVIERPDLIIAALPLDDDDAGLDAIRLIREQTPACVVLLSTESDPSLIDEARDAGVSGILFKPVDGVTLCREIGRAYETYRERIPWTARQEGSGHAA